MLAAVQAPSQVFKFLGLLLRTARAVYKMCLEVVLVVLAVFWFIPLAVMSAVFGEKFRDNVARFVSPRSIDTKTAAD